MSEKDSSLKKEQLYWYGSGRGAYVAPSTILAFANHIIATRQLPIVPVIEKLRRRDAFFLIAATGLGKTLIIPLWLLVRHMSYRRMRPPLAEGQMRIAAYSPRVWVVEPTIAICQGLAQTLNEDWAAWSAERVQDATISLFGCKTSMDHVNTDAAVVFLTTGMFAIYARNGTFRSGRDIVLIDEAHRTLEADEGVELGIGICHMLKIDVNYMSATVDASDLETALDVRIEHAEGIRQPIWRHNTQAPIEECIIELVRNTLVDRDAKSPFFPPAGTAHADEIISSVSESGRMNGMLILVNSYRGERSQAKRIERMLREAFPRQPFEIGLLASQTLRSWKQKKAYEEMLRRWKQERKRYVLIATSVVEMGVTLPDLDYVVTPDCDFKGESLSVNSLIQRIGRVGRQRPGIAYITREVGAPYAGLGDMLLNMPGALAPERIRFPMRKGTLTGLAYLTLQWNWPVLQEVEQLTGTLRLPSFDAESGAKLFKCFNLERQRLIELGVGTDNPPGLTSDGVLMERWVGRVDLKAAMQVHKAYSEKNIEGLLIALCLCAISITPLERVCRTLQDEPEKRGVIFSEIVKFLKIIIHSIFVRRQDSIYQQQELVDQIAEFLSTVDGDWMLFAEFLRSFVEVGDIFLGIYSASEIISSPKGPLELTKKWQAALRVFLDSSVE